MKIIQLLLNIFMIANSKEYINLNNGCIQFNIGQGTGCDWMCNYCSTNLDTNNYYFTDNVCTYKDGQGCVGNPIVGKTYTCCSLQLYNEIYPYFVDQL